VASVITLLLGAAVGKPQAQDLTTNTGVFVERPRNPPVRRDKPVARGRRGVTRPSPSAASSPGVASADSTPKKVSAEQAPKEVAPKPADALSAAPAEDRGADVEDALFFGNSARDAAPPRYEEAERAYKLAARLAPQDPRPYIGLGNIYYDRQQFQKAAEEYRKALDLSRPGGAGRELRGGRRGVRNDWPEARHHLRMPRLAALERETRADLAAALLGGGEFVEAEYQLGVLIWYEPKYDGWYAMMGSALSAQKRYAEAAEWLERAVKLAPEKGLTRELLRQVRRRQQEVVPLGLSFGRSLEETRWDVRLSRTFGGTCQLLKGGGVYCQPGDRLFGEYKWTTEGDVIHLTNGRMRCVGHAAGDALTFNCGPPSWPAGFRTYRWERRGN
jgi:tetratricopeptide (TPR) repeat protein